MRLVKIGKNPNQPMLQVDIPEGTGTWAFCSSQVQDYANKTLQLGDEVELTYTFANGRCDVTFIKKAGQQANTANQQPTGFQCTECGASLKDGRFKKCYTCNQNKGGQQTQSGAPASNFNCEECNAPLRDGKYKKCYPCNQKKPKQTKTDATGASIEKQNANKATAVALTAMIGQVNPNNVIGLVSDLYDAFIRNFKK